MALDTNNVLGAAEIGARRNTNSSFNQETRHSFRDQVMMALFAAQSNESFDKLHLFSRLNEDVTYQYLANVNNKLRFMYKFCEIYNNYILIHSFFYIFLN